MVGLQALDLCIVGSTPTPAAFNSASHKGRFFGRH